MKEPGSRDFTVEELEFALEYIAYAVVHLSPTYGAWLQILERALEEARRDNPVARAKAILENMSKRPE